MVRIVSATWLTKGEAWLWLPDYHFEEPIALLEAKCVDNRQSPVLRCLYTISSKILVEMSD